MKKITIRSSKAAGVIKLAMPFMDTHIYHVGAMVRTAGVWQIKINRK